MVIEEKFWQSLCTRLGMEKYAGDWPVVLFFSEDSPRRRNIVAQLTKIFETKTRQAWFELLSYCCVTPILDFEEVLADANTMVRELLVTIHDAKLGPVPCLGLPFEMSKTPGRIRSLPPIKGEHTDQILSELHYIGDEDLET